MLTLPQNWSTVYRIRDMYIGGFVPPEPESPYCDPEDIKQAREFWVTHAFVSGSVPMKPW